jgi:hypothetical protein
MEIDKKRFPINIKESKQAAKIFQNALKKRGHEHEIKKEDVYLTITPYWVAFYDVGYNNGKYNHVSGQIALNAVTNNINEYIIQLFDIEKPSVFKHVNIQKTENNKVIVKEAIIKEEEAKHTITKHLMQRYNIEEKNISLSGIEEILVPYWKLKTKEHNKLKFDAIDGSVNNFKTINEKEATYTDVYKEMISDLKSPKNILGYIGNILKGIGRGIKFMLNESWKHYKLLIIIIGIALIIYFLFFW